MRLFGGGLTIKKGAMSQFITMLNAIWIQISRLRKTWWRLSYLILQRMGYIMTSNPIAIIGQYVVPNIRYECNTLTDGNRDTDEFALL